MKRCDDNFYPFYFVKHESVFNSCGVYKRNIHTTFDYMHYILLIIRLKFSLLKCSENF